MCFQEEESIEGRRETAAQEGALQHRGRAHKDSEPGRRDVSFSLARAQGTRRGKGLDRDVRF